MTEMTGLLMSAVKDYSGSTLPEWLKGLAATGLFLALVLFVCGFSFFSAALDAGSPAYSAELLAPGIPIGRYLESGLASFARLLDIFTASGAGPVFLTLVFLLLWLLAMATLGLLSYLSIIFAHGLSGNFGAHPVGLEGEKLREAKLARKSIIEEAPEFKPWIDSLALLLYTLWGFIALLRAMLLIPFLAYLAFTLSLNIAPEFFEPGLLDWYDKYGTARAKASFLFLADSGKVGYLTDIVSASMVLLAMAWISFRYSRASRLLRFLCLILAVTNVGGLAARLGAIEGRALISFQQLSIHRAKTSDDGSLTNDRLLLVDRTDSHVTAFSCDSQRLLEIQLNSEDVVMVGHRVRLKELCRGESSS
jgi:hypothetical protein